MSSQHFSGSFGRNFVDSAIGIIFKKNIKQMGVNWLEGM